MSFCHFGIHISHYFRLRRKPTLPPLPLRPNKLGIPILFISIGDTGVRQSFKNQDLIIALHQNKLFIVSLLRMVMEKKHGMLGIRSRCGFNDFVAGASQSPHRYFYICTQEIFSYPYYPDNLF